MQNPLHYTFMATFDEKEFAKIKDYVDLTKELKEVLKVYGRKLQKQAVQNVSGQPVNWSGGTFIVNRQTGKLARSIKIVELAPLSVTVEAGSTVNGIHGKAYARWVESGHRAFDLKPYIMGKVIPLPIKTQQAKQMLKAGNAPSGLVLRKKYASTGKYVGQEAILFRRVTANSKGWIIPAQPPRPFMRAAAEMIEPEFTKAVRDLLSKKVGGNP